MYGYGSGDENVVHVPETLMWEPPQRLQSWASKQKPVKVDKYCESLQQLLKNESFNTFLRIFNTICARAAQSEERYGWESINGEEILRDKFTRDRAYALWKNLQLHGRVDVIRSLDDQLQKWMVQLDEIETKENEARTMRHIIGA